jgi:peptidyl-prolyl cis-trans isomerase SurA
MKTVISIAAVLLVVTAAQPLAQVPAQTPEQTPAQSHGMILEQVLFKVNGEIFTKTDLEARQITALRDQNRQINNPADLQNDASLKAMLLQVTPTLLVDAVDELLMLQRGRELGLTPTTAQVKDAADRIKAQNNITTDEQLRKALVESGMTYEEFEKNLATQYVIVRLQQQEIMPRVQLTDEEAKEYYRTHTKEFEKPATITIRDIFLSVPTVTQGGQVGTNAATDDEIARKIADIRARAMRGEAFTALVAEVSESPSKANGGLIGPINVSELAPQVRELVDKMKVGDISDPIRTPNGYQLIKLDSRVDAAPEPFEAVRDDIAERVGQSRMNDEQKKYIDRLRAQAIIEWKNDDLKKMYEEKMAGKSPDLK